MGIELQLKQNQTLSPQTLQSIKILQMPSHELEQYLNDLALENPTMDVTDSPKESIEQQQWLDSLYEENHYLYQRQRGDNDYNPKDTWNYNTYQSETLYDYLWAQLNTSDFTPQEVQSLDFMLQNLDERGYLSESVSDIADYLHLDKAVVTALLNTLQALEPVGVCAQSLQECLKLQLTARGLINPVFIQLIDEYLNLIAKNKITTIARKLHLPDEEIMEYCQIIKSLNPKPGSAFYNREEMKYIIPDVTIVKFNDHFDIVLNSSSYPEITVNSYYRKMTKQTDSAEVKEYLTQKINQVEWVRQCIVQRGKTLMSVSKEILRNQEDFFIYGPEHLHPFRMTDVAESLGIHESTVSRAVDKKYLQCTWGVYPIAFFFQRAAVSHSSGTAGTNNQSFTSADVKRALQELIHEENEKKPYSDRILSEMLTERNLPVSRRTVAKYREEEGIPDTSGRKFL